MLYRKNIYSWEQLLRVVGGTAIGAWGFVGAWGTLLGYGAAAAGVLLVLTGVVGWCPACAAVGRRLKDSQ
jgi:Protein of unknown function (DUF2892)